MLNFIDKQNVDVMTFQEAGSPDSFSAERLRPILEKKGWAVKTGEGSVITIYNANKYNEVELKEDNSVIRDAKVAVNGYAKLALVSKESKNETAVPDVIINNIWIRHEDFPHETESLITELLDSDNRNHKCDSIVVGDFNNRFAPANAKPGEIITTGAIPPYFNLNGADFTDGVLYKQQDQKQCHQGEIEILNPATGEIYPRTVANENDDLPEDMYRQRLILSCAVEHQEAGAIDPGLKKDLRDLKIHLSKTSNAHGEQGYAIHNVERDENWYELKAILGKLSPDIEFKQFCYARGQNGNYDWTILINKDQIKEVALALKIYTELGPSQRRLFAGDNNYTLTQIDELKEENAQKILVGEEFNKAMRIALDEYEAEMKKHSGILSSLFGAHGKTGLKRAADVREKINVAKTPAEYLSILAEVLDDKKVTLKPESLGSYIIKNLFENNVINAYLHLKEIEVNQYAKGRVNKRLTDKKKINVDSTLYDIDKEADRRKINKFVNERIIAKLEIVNMAQQEFKPK